jgi:tetratricopeptide (TPR) repeat protein
MIGRVASLALVALLASSVIGVVVGGGSANVAYADTPAKEASKHFQRGVALYGEADYRAALVEFRKAYEIAPNATVLYNIGQTYYQLQNYAAALTTLERYLNEAGAQAAHRSEVETTLEILQSRVGRVSVTSNVPGCEITIDDEHVSRTPLREPVLVSIGHRKVSADCDGHPAETRYVDVAAGDIAPVQFTLSDSSNAIGTPERPAVVVKPANWAYRLWVATVVLGASALVTGGIAFNESRDLKSLRGEGPVQPENGVARARQLDDKSKLVSRLSLAADVLGVATLVTGGIALKLSMSKTTEVRVSVTPGGLQVAGTFR